MIPIDEQLKKHGFDRIGRIDSVGRRSLWLKSHYDDVDGAQVLVALELRAGREGRDDHCLIRASDVSPEVFRALDDVLSTARFAAEWEDPDGNALETTEEQNGDETA